MKGQTWPIARRIRAPICSLCCTLDARCGDMCKPHANLATQWSAALRWLLPKRVWPFLDTGLGHFLLLMLVILPLLATVFAMFYQAGVGGLGRIDRTAPGGRSGVALRLQQNLCCADADVRHRGLVAGAGAQKPAGGAGRVQPPKPFAAARDRVPPPDGRCLARSQACSRASPAAGRAANQAKSRYISAISHELRTPLNSILGYAQLMGEDAAIPPPPQAGRAA